MTTTAVRPEIVSWGSEAYAGFWRRFLGHAVDSVLLFSVYAFGLVLLGVLGVGLGEPPDADPLFWTYTATVYLVWGVYRVVLTARWGATVGKLAAGIQVRAADGTLLTAGHATRRLFARILSYLPLRLGFLWAAWDPRKQTWHDHLVSTYVLKNERLVAVSPMAQPTAAGTSGLGAAQSVPGRGTPAWAGSPSAAVPSGRAGRHSAAPADARAPHDPNQSAIDAASIPAAMATWLHEVAGQVDGRLDRVDPAWRERDQAEAARACGFGLLLGRLAAEYPDTRPVLSSVAEAHPGFETLLAGSRLETLEQIAADPVRVRAWLGSLLDPDGREGAQRFLE